MNKNIKKANKSYMISFLILLAIGIIFAAFAISEIVSSTGGNKALIYGLVALLFIGFSLFYYKFFVKSYLIEEEDYFTVGHLNKEDTVYYKDIDKIIRDIKYYMVYTKNNEKVRVPATMFEVDKLNDYIDRNFKIEEEDTFKIVYVRNN